MCAATVKKGGTLGRGRIAGFLPVDNPGSLQLSSDPKAGVIRNAGQILGVRLIIGLVPTDLRQVWANLPLPGPEASYPNFVDHLTG